ncbi:MAG: hypothetical protein AB7P52_03695 [Alphaproteobacteria bacterium]
MTGFFENLARRAAGLAPPPGMTAARVRPLARFEPASLGGEAPPLAVSSVEVESGRPPNQGEPQGIRPGEEAPASALRQEPARREPTVRVERDIAPRQPSDIRSELHLETPHAKAVAAVPPPVQTPLRSEGHPHEAAVHEPVGTLDRDNRTSGMPPRFVESERTPATPRAVIVPPAERVQPSPELPPRSTEASTEPTPARARTTARIEAGEPSVPPRREVPARPDERAPAVSVSIGRIEIEVAPPPAPAASRPPVERTRGFAGYARARRGQPR